MVVCGVSGGVCGDVGAAMNAPDEGEITRAMVAEAWQVDMQACRRCGFVHRRGKRWGMYDRAAPGVPCWTREDVEVEYESLTARALTSGVVPNVGQWRRWDALAHEWPVRQAIEACWPPECLTRAKVRSPRADVRMQEWCAWVYAGVGKGTPLQRRRWVNVDEARAFLLWALDQSREEIEAVLAMKALR
jgi:hypothetical protein